VGVLPWLKISLCEKNGSLVHGKILQDEKAVLLQLDYGTIPVPRSQIKTIHEDAADDAVLQSLGSLPSGFTDFPFAKGGLREQRRVADAYKPLTGPARRLL
jgi:hypothetical protein